jgi:hypothetical protein
MAMAQIPQQVASRRAAFSEGEPHWTRSLAIGSLITGTVLLLRGRRKAGLAAAIAGAAIALLEKPEDVGALWRQVPSYLDSGKRLLSRLEGLVEDLSGQGSRLKGLLDRAQR